MGGFNEDVIIGLIVSVFFSSLAWVGIPLTIIYFITFPEGSSSIASPPLHDRRIDSILYGINFNPLFLMSFHQSEFHSFFLENHCWLFA